LTEPSAVTSARFWSGLVSGFLTAHRNLVTVLLLSWTSRFDSDFHLVTGQISSHSVLHWISSLDFSPALKCRVICFSQQIFHSRVGSLSAWSLLASGYLALASSCCRGFPLCAACFLHNSSIGSGTVPVIYFASCIRFFH
jgi:hypothetical protein